MHARTHAHTQLMQPLWRDMVATTDVQRANFFFALISRDVIRNAFEHNRKEDFGPSGFQSLVFRSVQCCNITTIRETWKLGLDSCNPVQREIKHEILIIYKWHNIIPLQPKHDYYRNTRWFKYDRDWFVCKQAALRSSCATLREWSHNLHPPSCSG